MSASKRNEYLFKNYELEDGAIVTIVEYETCKNITIEFEYGYRIKTTLNILNKRKYKHPNLITIYGRGYLGFGKYKPITNSKLYQTWRGMLRRCYSNHQLLKNPTYKDVTVCEEWYNFQNFAEWFENNFNPETMQDWHLDKDILIKGNKIYSPETCCFVPAEINGLLIKRQNDRGDCPIGVSYNKRDNLYGIVLSGRKRNQKYNFKTIEEAFQAYKTDKEEHIKEVADKWKDKIDQKVYEALINYKVEITD